MSAPPGHSANTDVRQRYDAWHGALDRGSLDTPWHRMLLQRIEPARWTPATRVLEVACGRGEFSEWLQRSSEAQVWAADFSVTALAKVPPSLLGALHLAAADIQRLPFETAAFDIVFCCETLEHVPEPRAALAELRRVLRPHGTLYLTTPNYLNASGLYRLYLKLRGRQFSEAGQPLNHPLLLPRVLAWLRDAGFRSGAVDGEGHFFPLLPGRAAAHARWLDHVRPVSKWFAAQTMVIAEAVP